MADPNSSEFPKPAQPTEQPKAESKVNRRSVVKGLLGLAGVIVAGRNAEGAHAQTSVQPVDSGVPLPGYEGPAVPKKDLGPKATKEVPKDFKEPIEKAIKTASNFLDNPQGIKSSIAESNVTRVTTTYDIDVDDATGEETITGNQTLIVTHSDNDKTPVRYTNLVVGENLGKLVSKSHGNYMVDRFSDAVWENFNLDLKKLDPKQTPAEEMAKLARLAHLFDFANYTDGINRQAVPEDLKTINETLFNKAFAIWMFEPDELVNKLNITASNDKAAYANVFLKVLRETLECVSKEGVRFDDLGFDKKNIYKVVEMSKNPRFKKYFDEKIELMGKPLAINEEHQTLPEAA